MPLTNDGDFNVYNLQGNVHLIIDVTGYYQDHTHDDRYDTKSQIDDKIDNALASQPWSIFVAPSDFETNRWDTGNANNVSSYFWPAVTFANGVSTLGLAFNDGSFRRVFYGYRLPDNYVAGTDLRVTMHYVPVSGFGLPVLPCDTVWQHSGPAVTRANAPAFFADFAWEIPRGFSAGWTRLESVQADFDEGIIRDTHLTVDGTDLRPGDMMTAGLARDGDESDDTCEGMMVTGLVIEPAP